MTLSEFIVKLQEWEPDHGDHQIEVAVQTYTRVHPGYARIWQNDTLQSNGQIVRVRASLPDNQYIAQKGALKWKTK